MVQIYSVLHNRFIHRFCTKANKNISSAEFIQSPVDWKKLLITGINVEDVRVTLAQEIASSKFSEFTIYTQNTSVDGPLPTRQMAGNHGDEVPSLRMSASSWKNGGSCFCELLLVSKKTRLNLKAVKSTEEKPGFYAVVPAHLMMFDEESRDKAATSSIADIRKKFEVVNTSCSLKEEGKPPYKFNNRAVPLLFYRYFIGKTDTCPVDHDQCLRYSTQQRRKECPHLFLNDMALLHLDQDSAVQFQNHLATVQRTKEEMVKILEPDSLSYLVTQNMEVGDFSGKFTRAQPLPVGGYMRYAAYAPFVLTSSSSSSDTKLE